MRRIGGMSFIEMAPDRAPAEHLRDLLADDRRSGLMTFEEAWGPALEYVLSCVPDEESASWRQAFAETRFAWAAAWIRGPVPSALTVDLIDGGQERIEIHRHAVLVA
jgi:hypothetical protein